MFILITKQIKRRLAVVAVIVGVVSTALLIPSGGLVAAQSLTFGGAFSGVVATACPPPSTVDVSPLPGSCSDPTSSTYSSSVIQTALNILFSVVGAIALLIITISGFRYVISRGEPQEVARAKDTIIYALIGLVICMAALAIVNFVAGNV